MREKFVSAFSFLPCALYCTQDGHSSSKTARRTEEKNAPRTRFLFVKIVRWKSWYVAKYRVSRAPVQIYSYFSAEILYWLCRECMVWTPEHDLHSRRMIHAGDIVEFQAINTQWKKNCTSFFSLLHFLFPVSQGFVCHERKQLNESLLLWVPWPGKTYIHLSIVVERDCQIQYQLCQGIFSGYN